MSSRCLSFLTLFPAAYQARRLKTDTVFILSSSEWNWAPRWGHLSHETCVISGEFSRSYFTCPTTSKEEVGQKLYAPQSGLVWKQIFKLTCQLGCQLGSTLDEAVRTPQQRRLLTEAEAAWHKGVCNQERACLRPAPSDSDCWCSFSSPIWFV